VLLTLLIGISSGVAAVLLGVPMPWQAKSGTAEAGQSIKKDLAVSLVDGQRHTVAVPHNVQRTLGIRKGGVEAIAVAKAPTQTRPLVLRGTTALDPSRIIHIRVRFAPADTVAIKIVPDTQTYPTEFHEIRPGDVVKKGQELCTLVSPDVGNKKNDLFEAIIQKRLAEVLLDKLETAGSSVPDYLLWNARVAVETNESTIRRARNMLKLWNISEEDIIAVEKEAKDLNIVAGRRMEVAKDWAEKHIDWAKVILRAPDDGVVVECNVAKGETVVDNTLNLFTIAKPEQLMLSVNCPEDDLLELYRLRDQVTRLGQQLKWTIQTVGANKDGREGTISSIGQIIDPNQHSAIVKGYISNPGDLIRAGQFVSATVKLAPPDDVVEIPIDAVVDDGRQCLVFVQSKEDKTHFTMKRLDVTARFDRTAFVRCKDVDEQLTPEEKDEGLLPKQPLREKDRVLTRGALELKAALLDKETETKKE
jgi:cobalt-zinc-cadmium efflux system membrane fusion protein